MSVRVADGPQELEMMDWMTRIALEAVSQAGFGHSFEALDDIEAKDNAYADAIKQLVQVKFWLSTVHFFLPQCYRQPILPKLEPGIFCYHSMDLQSLYPKHVPLSCTACTIERRKEPGQHTVFLRQYVPGDLSIEETGSTRRR
jgi:hypothetical protein